MPHAIKLDKTYAGQGLRVILVHTQTELDDVATFVMKRFPETEAMVTADNPIPFPEGTTIRMPRCALIGVDGTYLIEGLRAEVGKKVDRMIVEELQKMKKGWGTCDTLRKARAQMHGRKNLADARALLDSFQPRDEAEAEDLADARRELKARHDAAVTTIRHAMAGGRWNHARDLAATFARGVEGAGDWEAEAATFSEQLASKRGRRERKMADRIDKVLRQIRSKGVREGLADKLRKIAGGDRDLSAWGRAMRLSVLCDRVGGSG